MYEQFLEWCYTTPVLAFLRDSRYGMPVAQSLHIFGFTILLGCTIVFNLRLMRVGFRETRLSALTESLWPLSKRGLALTLAAGLMVFIVDPKRYLANGPFKLKMALLLAALVFQFTVFKRTVAGGVGDAMPIHRRWMIAAASLLVWFGVGWAGRFIGFL